MRVLIQNCDSLKFYAYSGSRTDFAGNATDFQGSIRALDYIQEHQIERAQIVLKFEKDEFDVCCLRAIARLVRTEKNEPSCYII